MVVTAVCRCPGLAQPGTEGSPPMGLSELSRKILIPKAIPFSEGVVPEGSETEPAAKISKSPPLVGKLSSLISASGSIVDSARRFSDRTTLHIGLAIPPSLVTCTVLLPPASLRVSPVAVTASNVALPTFVPAGVRCELSGDAASVLSSPITMTAKVRGGKGARAPSSFLNSKRGESLTRVLPWPPGSLLLSVSVSS